MKECQIDKENLYWFFMSEKVCFVYVDLVRSKLGRSSSEHILPQPSPTPLEIGDTILEMIKALISFSNHFSPILNVCQKQSVWTAVVSIIHDDIRRNSNGQYFVSNAVLFQFKNDDNRISIDRLRVECCQRESFASLITDIVRVRQTSVDHSNWPIHTVLKVHLNALDFNRKWKIQWKPSQAQINACSYSTKIVWKLNSIHANVQSTLHNVLFAQMVWFEVIRSKRIIWHMIFMVYESEPMFEPKMKWNIQYIDWFAKQP